MNSMKISLAGDLGSGKSTVGKILAQRFGAEVYSTGTIQRQIATEMGMTTLQLNQYMETHPEIDGKIDDGLRALENAEKNLIIDSRMAWHFVPSSFSVYMAADSYVSAARILNAGRASEPFHSVKEAVASIRDRRKSEMVRYSHLYNVNIKDLTNYDYVIDTSYLTPETVADCIAARFVSHCKGEKFLPADICAQRLLPCADEEGETTVTEKDGYFYLLRGQKEAAEKIRSGQRLLSCLLVKADGNERALCSRARVAEWEKETGIKVAALPDFLKA